MIKSIYSASQLDNVEIIEKRLLNANINFFTKFVKPGPEINHVCKIYITDDIAPEMTRYSIIMLPMTPYSIKPQLLVEDLKKREFKVHPKSDMDSIIAYLKQRKAFG